MKANFLSLKALTISINIALLPVASFAVYANAVPIATAVTDAHTPGTDPILAAEQQKTAAPATPNNQFRPAISQLKPDDQGKRMRTHYVIQNRLGVNAKTIGDLAQPEPQANLSPNFYMAETPASLACIYKMGPSYLGCKPIIDPTKNATGGSGAIAIVDAFDNPTIHSDLKKFSSFFGLPAPKLEVIKMNNSCFTPPVDSGWSVESSLDVQWAHAMAPDAKIFLVEACSNSLSDLIAAEQIAGDALVTYGGGVISNSWGGPEFLGENNFDSTFYSNNWPNTSIVFSSGDFGGEPEYPSTSPWVTAVGGTTINREPFTGEFLSESCWYGSGGGTSWFETYNNNTFLVLEGTGPWTNYQYPLFGEANRSTPDISFNADPASGVWVRYAGNWLIVGGTSVGAPSIAGIINNANNRLGNAPANGGYYSNNENNLIYSELLTHKEYANNFYDVTTGSNGYNATPGWDFCTGVGSPRGRNGK